MADRTRPSMREILLPGPGKALAEPTRVIRGCLDRTSALMRRAMTGHVPHPDIARETDETRRFQAAMAVSGRGEADLPSIEKAAGTRFEIFAIATMFALMWTIVAPSIGLGGQTGLPWLNAFFPLAFTAWLASNAFASAVTLRRIQLRRMIGVREFMRDPSAWWGGPPSRGATLCLAALAAGLGLSVMAPYPALAQATTQSAAATIAGLWTMTGAEDLSMEWLRRLFPAMQSLACPTGASCPDSDADMLAAMMGVLNAVLLGLASAMLAFQTIVGTVQTAHEGKVMGARWHTIWAPIRVVAGVGMLVPIKGYCGLQFVMLMLIVAGYNLANGLWAAYVNKAFDGSMASLAVTSTPNLGLNIAHSVLASETCAAVLRGHAAGLQAGAAAAGGNATPPRRGTIGGTLAQGAAGATGGVSPFGPAIREMAATPSPQVSGTRAADGTISWDWGSVCGRITTLPVQDPLSTSRPVAQAYATGTANSVSPQAAQSISEQAVTRANTAYRAFLIVRDQEVATLVGAVREANIHGYVASSVISNLGANGEVGQNIPDAEEVASEVMRRYLTIRTAAADFDRNIDEAARAMAQAINSQGSDQFIARARALGWASAGAMDATLMRAGARAMELVGTAAPQSRGPDPTRLANTLRGATSADVEARLAQSMEFVRRTVANANLSVIGGQGTDRQSVAIGADIQSRNVLAQLMKPLSDRMTAIATDGLGYINPIRPMSSIQNFGNTMLATGQGMLLTWVSLKGAASGVAGQQVASFMGGGVMQGILEGIAPFFVPIMAATLICGALHAYVLPILPFLIWFYAVISVVSVAAELVIAAPIAAFMHVRADGEELINGQQRPIYTMVFNALLRPSLLLCGLATANLVFAAMCNYLNKVYGMAVATTNGDSVVGIVGFITMTILIFYLHYQLVTRSMQLISAVPSVVAELVGARDQDRQEQEGGRQVFAAVTNISSRGGQGLQAGLAAGGRRSAEKAETGADSQKLGGIEGAGGGTRRTGNSVAPVSGPKPEG